MAGALNVLAVQLLRRRGTFTLDVAFQAPSPGLVALFGPSGCGKTTTIELIAGLLRPDAGHIALGSDTLFDAAQGIEVPSEQRRIGCVFQDARLFPHLSVRSNLCYGFKRARHLARYVGFDEVVELLGLAALLGRHPRALSGGERQRVALGRALLAQPRLLLLDEPLASLDLARREELLPYLERLRDRLSIPMVYVSHQFEEVLRLATHLVVMRAGHVLAQGEVASLTRSPELRSMVGPETLGAVLEGVIAAVDGHTGLARLRVGEGELLVQAQERTAGERVRVQLLARDLILAIEPPRGLSVRNALAGHICAITTEADTTRLVEIDVGGAIVLAQVTEAAAVDLKLARGRAVWVLVKAVSLRGHVYAFASPREAPSGAAPPR